MDKKRHSLQIQEREALTVEGVLRVDTTTEQKITLHSVLGDMVILGEGLHIRHLDLEAGNAIFGGRINSVSYPEKILRGRDKKRAAAKGGLLFKG